ALVPLPGQPGHTSAARSLHRLDAATTERPRPASCYGDDGQTTSRRVPANNPLRNKIRPVMMIRLPVPEGNRYDDFPRLCSLRAARRRYKTSMSTAVNAPFSKRCDTRATFALLHAHHMTAVTDVITQQSLDARFEDLLPSICAMQQRGERVAANGDER